MHGQHFCTLNLTFMRTLVIYRACCESSLNINGTRTFLANFHGRPSIDRGDLFFANNSLTIEFKGILVKLKNVPCVISIEYLIFTGKGNIALCRGSKG